MSTVGDLLCCGVRLNSHMIAGSVKATLLRIVRRLVCLFFTIFLETIFVGARICVVLHILNCFC